MHFGHRPFRGGLKLGLTLFVKAQNPKPFSGSSLHEALIKKGPIVKIGPFLVNKTETKQNYSL